MDMLTWRGDEHAASESIGTADSYRSQDLEYLGMVPGVCQEIGLVERVEELVAAVGETWKARNGE